MKCRKVITLSLMTTVVALGLSLCIGTSAWAQAAGPCAPDVAKLCSTVKPGGGRIVECLRSHAAEVSAACTARMTALTAQLVDTQVACWDDIEQLCPGVQPGQARQMECLKEHQANISAECKEAVAKLLR
jgi:hypothetical protein